MLHILVFWSGALIFGFGLRALLEVRTYDSAGLWTSIGIMMIGAGAAGGTFIL